MGTANRQIWVTECEWVSERERIAHRNCSSNSFDFIHSHLMPDNWIYCSSVKWTYKNFMLFGLGSLSFCVFSRPKSSIFSFKKETTNWIKELIKCWFKLNEGNTFSPKIIRGSIFFPLVDRILNQKQKPQTIHTVQSIDCDNYVLDQWFKPSSIWNQQPVCVCVFACLFQHHITLVH